LQPTLSRRIEEFLRRKKIDEETAQKAGEIALDDAKPLKDNVYKVGMSKSLIQRAAHICLVDPLAAKSVASSRVCHGKIPCVFSL